METGEKETAYIPIRVLGRGAFGEAMLYRKVADNSLVVWKEVMLSRLSDKEKKDAQNEIDILSMLNHANIVSYYNHFLDGDKLLIEMEYANDGSLCEKLSLMKDLLPENEILWYLYQLVSAVAHIHEYDIIHRDIKTMNIFLTKTGLIKLGDFGISRIMSSKSHMAQTYVGTIFYMSPELVKGDPYNFKSDIWSIGCVLYEMLTLSRVFDATNALRLANDIVHGSFDDVSPKYSVEIRNLCNTLLNKDPSKRPVAEDILMVPLLDNSANEFDGRIWDFNASARTLKMSASAATQAEVMPVITSQSSEVYFWGGGRQTPQKQEIFTRGRSPLDIAVGGVHFAVATVEKELYTWAGPVGFGSGIVGQLGHGDTAAYKAPKKVEALESVSIKQVSCGEDFTACVSDSGSVYTFGSDYHGCLGCDNQEGDEVCTPVLIDFFTSKPVDQISCGDAHVVALTKDGEVYTWGCGEYGRLGLGSEEDFAVPQKVQTRGKHAIRSVHAGSDNTFVVKTNGRVLACGSNDLNKLGCNSAAHGLYKRKEQISYDIQCRYNLGTVKPLIKHNIQTIAPGPTHTGAIDSGGHLIMFGSNKYGQLGVGDYKERSGVTLVSGVLGGQKVTKVSCGDGFTVIATADNLVYSWGLGENGRLGTDTADQGKGPDGHCFALPRPIFGALHRVSAINSFRWNTGVIAEKVLSQKTIRSTSTGVRVYNNMCSEESQASIGDSVFNGSTRLLDGDSPPVDKQSTPAAIMEESAQMPWLQAELEGEYIPVEKPAVPDTPALTPAVEESVPPPWLRKELDEAEVIPITPDNSAVVDKVNEDTDTQQNTFTSSEGGVSNGSPPDTELARLSALVSQLEFEVTSLREENKALKERNTGLSESLGELEKHNKKLQSQIEQQAETIMTQAHSNKQLEDKLTSLEEVEQEIWQAVDVWTEDCMKIKHQMNNSTHKHSQSQQPETEQRKQPVGLANLQHTIQRFSKNDHSKFLTEDQQRRDAPPMKAGPTENLKIKDCQNNDNTTVKKELKSTYHTKFGLMKKTVGNNGDLGVSHGNPGLVKQGRFSIAQGKSGIADQVSQGRKSSVEQRSSHDKVGSVIHRQGSIEKYNISVKDVVRNGSAIDVLFEPCDDDGDAWGRGRLNSADDAYTKSAFVPLKRTRSVPEQMNLQLELQGQGPTRMVEKPSPAVDGPSQELQDKWRAHKCDMLRKSYTPSTLNKTRKDFTTQEQRI